MHSAGICTLLLGLVTLCWCEQAQDTNKIINVPLREQPLPLEYEDFGASNGGEEEDEIHVYQGVRGRAGLDFPMYEKIPHTNFSCRNMKGPGYFADLDTNCQVFHLCEGGRKMSFLCPNGTIFRQSKLTCDWWFKVDCKSSEDFYDSSAEQLRHDRTGSAGKTTTESANYVTIQQSRQESRTNLLKEQPKDSNQKPRSGKQVREPVRLTIDNFGDKNTEPSVTTTYRPITTTYRPITTTYRPITTTYRPITTTYRPVNKVSFVSQNLREEGITRRYYEESQEVAETGSFIIPRRREEKSKSVSTSYRKSYSSFTTTTRPETTTLPQATETYPPPTEVPTTEINDLVTESLIGSHSSWFNSPTDQPYTTQEDLRQVTYYTTPDSTQVPSARLAPLITDRSARGFSSNPRPRPGLNDIPLSASPQALHSLARYFAADNQTRREMEKQVPAGTMELMESLTESSTERLNPDLRQLAQIFSKALSDYLEDPETFRETLKSVRPTDAPPLRNSIDDDRDEVLDYSDIVNTRKPKTTTEVPATTTIEYPRKNEVASIVNEVLQEPIGRKIPEINQDNTLIREETQYGGYSSTPSDINFLGFTTIKPQINFVDPIPSSTSYPITPEPIPEEQFSYSVPEYIEIGYPKSRPLAPRNLYIPHPETSYEPPNLDSVLQHFAPHDLNSLAIFSVHTNPSPAPVSVAVHIPPHNTDVQHRVTVLASTHSTNRKNVATYRPMISKLLFPSPDQEKNKTYDFGESLITENTASFPSSFISTQSLAKQGLIKSWISEDKSVSELITETIPTTTPPNYEPVTEAIPYEDTAEIPTARKVGDGQQLVLLLVNNGANKETARQINKSKLLTALLDANKTNSAEATESITITTELPITTTEEVTVTSALLTVTPNRKSTKQPEVTTYRSAHHKDILTKVRESQEVVESSTASSPSPSFSIKNLNFPIVNSNLPPLQTNNSTHPDSRAFDILKSLYSLASRWG